MSSLNEGGKRTKPQPFHNHALTAKTRITMQLHAHNLVSQLAVRRRRFEQRILLCTRLSESDGVDGLCISLLSMRREDDDDGSTGENVYRDGKGWEEGKS